MNTSGSRREFLRNLALATLVLPGTFPAWAQQKIGKDPFGLGVASGSATHESVVLWTRLYDEGMFGSNLPNETISVKWEVATDSSFGKVVKSGVSNAIPGLAHSVHVEVSGLQPDNWYFYRFRVNEFISPVGKTRTFAPPAQAGGSLRIAFASCQNFELGYFNSYPHLTKDSPDLMIFLGDYIYEMAPGRTGVRNHVGSWVLSLDDYRKRYAQYKEDVQLQQLHACCPWLVTWDDHEVQNDYAGTQEGSYGPSTNFSKRRAAAYQAFYEHMPLRASVLVKGIDGLESGAEMRIYENYRIGRLASISMLDTRQYRSPQACTPGGKYGSGVIDPAACNALQDDSRTMLGAAQERWLQKQLEEGRSQVWTLIAQSTLFGPRKYRVAEGVRVWNDGWDGYPAARKRLTALLHRNQVPNPVILGGDVHENWVGYVKEDYNSSSSADLGIEFCGTSVSSYDGKPTAAVQPNNPHFIYSEGTRKGYAICEVSEKELVVHLRAVKDHRTAESEIETLASFRVIAGTRKLEAMPKT